MSSVAYMRPETSVYGQPDGDFVAYHDIVVFDEHERDGVVVDRAYLESIVDGCNYRIQDTGDFCTLVIGHTGEKEDSPDPEVVGFSGNYKVIDNFGALAPRSAITATWWIYREHDDDGVMKKYPRRSVELWPEDKYFDPIALLGAETPCRDLGLAYEKGGKSIRYEMEGSVASGGNTFIPDLGNEKKKKKYAMGDPIDSEVMAQLTQAFVPIIQGIVTDQLNIAPPPPPAELEPERNELDIMADEPEVEVDIDVDADGEEEDPAMDYEKDGDDVDDKKLDDEHPKTDSTDSIEGDPKDFKEKYHKYQFSKFSKMEGDEAVKCAMKYMAGLDEGDMGEVMGMLDTGSEDESEQEFFSKVKYSAAEAKEDEDGEEESAEVKASKYRKSHREMSDKYAKLEVKHKKVQAELDGMNEKVRYAKRKSDLIELQSEGFAMDIDEEMEYCADFSDAQFSGHLDRIPSKYHKVPIGGPGLVRLSEAPNHDPDSKDAKNSEAALAACKKYKKTDYGKVLKNVKANNGVYVEA